MSDFARLASFDGRARRSMVWWAVIGATLVLLAPVTTGGFLMLLNLPGWSPTAVLDGPEAGWAIWQQVLSAVYLAALIPTLWLLLATLVRRCHDRNWSGAFLLVGLIPVAQIWPLVELGLLDGTPGENAFGLSPKLSSAEASPEPRQDAVAAPAAAWTREPAAGHDPFALSPARPPADYRFDDAPLTLEKPPEAIVQPREPREPRARRAPPLIFAPLVKYARFDGRARRWEYWLFALFRWALLIGVGVGLLAILPPGWESAVFVLMGVGAVVIVLFLPHLAVTARRLHDSGLSFAWWLVTLIPVIGSLIGLVLMSLGGTPGPNAYGPNPRKP